MQKVVHNITLKINKYLEAVPAIKCDIRTRKGSLTQLGVGKGKGKVVPVLN
jgi:hypothetical protein